MDQLSATDIFNMNIHGLLRTRLIEKKKKFTYTAEQRCILPTIHVGISRPKISHSCGLLIGSGARQKGRQAHFNSAVIGINKSLDEELAK